MTGRWRYPDASTGARVRRVTVGPDGLATGAEWIDRDGHEHHQAAATVLVAANAVGTARLLLASADARHPDGLANSSGLVGRRLMLHPLSTVLGIFDDAVQGWPALILDAEGARRWRQGTAIPDDDARGPVRAYSSTGEWLGTGHADATGLEWRPRKVVAEEESAA